MTTDDRAGKVMDMRENPFTPNRVLFLILVGPVVFIAVLVAISNGPGAWALEADWDGNGRPVVSMTGDRPGKMEHWCSQVNQPAATEEMRAHVERVKASAAYLAHCQ